MVDGEARGLRVKLTGLRASLTHQRIVVAQELKVEAYYKDTYQFTSTVMNHTLTILPAEPRITSVQTMGVHTDTLVTKQLRIVGENIFVLKVPVYCSFATSGDTSPSALVEVRHV